MWQLSKQYFHSTLVANSLLRAFGARLGYDCHVDGITGGFGALRVILYSRPWAPFAVYAAASQRTPSFVQSLERPAKTSQQPQLAVSTAAL
jgi:hypothetical protein